MYDVKVLDILTIEAGAFYVMDRAYVDYARLYNINQSGAFFVTRAKRSMNARRVYSNTIYRTTGIICDQVVVLNAKSSFAQYPEHIRRIKLKDSETGKTLVFIPIIQRYHH